MKFRVNPLACAGCLLALTAWPATTLAAQSSGQASTSTSQTAAPSRSQTPSGDQQSQHDSQPAQNATAIQLGDLEEHPDRYIGRAVSVTGEVQRVLGPRLFALDEVNWVDFDGETLIYVPAPLAAFVSDDQPATVTGVVRRIADVEIEREWGWFDMDDTYVASMRTRPVIIANRVTSPGGMLLVARYGEPGTSGGTEAPTGTSGSDTGRATGNAGANPATSAPSEKAAQQQMSQPMSQQRAGETDQYAGSSAHGSAPAATGPLTDAAMLGRSDDPDLVGRSVSLRNVRVQTATSQPGFWAGQGDARLFVLPSDSTSVSTGDTVSIDGTVMQMPSGMRNRLGGNAADEQIYVFARSVTK